MVVKIRDLESKFIRVYNFFPLQSYST